MATGDTKSRPIDRSLTDMGTKPATAQMPPQPGPAQINRVDAAPPGQGQRPRPSWGGGKS